MPRYESTLQAPQAAASWRRDVFEEHESTSRLQDPVDVAVDHLRISNGAQDERAQHNVNAPILDLHALGPDLSKVRLEITQTKNDRREPLPPGHRGNHGRSSGCNIRTPASGRGGPDQQRHETR